MNEPNVEDRKEKYAADAKKIMLKRLSVINAMTPYAGETSEAFRRRKQNEINRITTSYVDGLREINYSNIDLKTDLEELLREGGVAEQAMKNNDEEQDR